MKNTIEENWLSYKEAVIPATASTIQIEETKKAFFAGAHSMLYILCCEENKDMADEAFAELMCGLNDEIEMFINCVKAGEINVNKLSS